MCTPSDMWNRQVEELLATSLYTILLIDNRGSGKSTIPSVHDDSNNAGYDMITMARDIWAIVDVVLGRHTKPHLVGHSMGSMIVQRAALLAPSRVASLTFISGHAGGWFWNWIPPPALMQAGIDLIRTGFDPNVAADVYMRLHYTKSFLDDWTIDEKSGIKVQRKRVYYKRYLDGMLRDRIIDSQGNGFWGQLAAVRSHSLTKEEATKLKQLAVPKLVIFGENDGVVLPRASKELAFLIDSQVISVPGSHFLIEESAHDVNQLLRLHFDRAAPVDGIDKGFVIPIPNLRWPWELLGVDLVSKDGVPNRKPLYSKA